MESYNEVVRMILWDYDAAPDGNGAYVKLDARFSSLAKAIQYRDVQLRGMYWGHIETLDGTLLQHLEEQSEEYDWSEHESRCDGCAFCNPTAFRDED